ncbi:hypothetical protein CFIMG_007566RA00001 [Ceratocystis fimbriata CBS 114723]|uniref:Uncharacterized protein n=1 Tax=Ceratocystis fimbriata CBS 114723 TaxID=1035309 RepID=A0A2C5XEG6_9PEZI|nr:hypothetical protein CFIMG_007566RA00001 [Ceratocystis fimbriata CBS 114723]
MRFPMSYLALALPLFSAVQADIFTDHNYDLKVLYDGRYLIFSPEYHEGCEILDLIEFYPEAKIANIRVARNDEEEKHKNKLDLTEIYTTLAETSNLKPDDMRWVVFDVDNDPKTNKMIAKIRNNHRLRPKEEVKIIPTDTEWNTIMGTQYYRKILQIMDKPVQKILLRNQDCTSRSSEIQPTDRIHFSFLPSKDAAFATELTTDGLATKTWPPNDGEEAQEAALKALFAEEDKKEPEF